MTGLALYWPRKGDPMVCYRREGNSQIELDGCLYEVKPEYVFELSGIKGFLPIRLSLDIGQA
jgi:hypothetical protein